MCNERKGAILWGGDFAYKIQPIPLEVQINIKYC